jgi:hypothetical protein
VKFSATHPALKLPPEAKSAIGLLCIPVDGDPFLGLIAGADLFKHAWRELGDQD